jgi:hypothetical protein
MPVSTALEALIKRAEEIAARGGKPFATNVRPKAKPGDPNFVGPVEPIGPNQITPQTLIGPPERFGPPEMQGPRQITPETLIGPAERQGPQLPFRTNVRLKPQPETGTDFTMVNPPSRAVTMRDIGSEAASSPGTALTTANPLATVDRFGRPNMPPRLTDILEGEFREIPRPSTLGPVSAADELAFRTVRPQTLSREELLAMRGPEQGAMSAGAPYSGSYLPLFAGSVLGGTALLSGGQQAQNDAQRRQFLEALNGNEPNRLDPNLFGVQRPTAGMDRTNTLGVDELSAYPAGAVHNYNRSNAPGVDETSAYPRNTVQLAKQRMAPMPPSRELQTQARAEQPSSGGLSRFFSDPYAGKSARDLYAEANKMQSSGDEYGSNLLMQRAGKMITKPEDLESTGMATGGAAKPHKDAALHKALDIISHMLGRQ